MTRKMPEDMGMLKETAVLQNKIIAQEKKLKALEDRLRALKDVESNFSGLLETSSVGIIMVRPNKQIAYVNPHLAKILGRNPDQLIGKSFINFVQPEQAKEMVELIDMHLGGARNLGTFQGVVKHKSGRKLFLEFEGSIINMNDEVLDFILVRDVSERKRMETALRESEGRLKSIIEHSHDIIYSYNQEGIVTFINDGVRKYGYNPKKIVGRNFSMLIHDGDRERVNKTFQKALKTGQCNPIEYRIMKKDGGFAYVEEFCKFVMGDGGIIQINGVIRDITERVAAEHDRSRLEEQLRQAVKMEAIGRLAGGVAHDFNNILTGIIGYSEVALGNVEEETPIHECLKEILSAGERAAKLTGQLLAFSRKQIIDPKVMQINETLELQQKLLRRIIGEDIHIKMTFSGQLGCIKADATQIDQILINLATNARDAMPLGGELTITTQNITLKKRRIGALHKPISGRFILLTVSDTGQGMSREIQDKLFEPFFTTKSKGKGTGLGLSTVYGIVKQNNAFIDVVSRPQKGSTFKIYFPRVDDPILTEPPIRIAALPTGTETILLVEDEVIVRKLARKILENKGYKILEAQDVDDALKIGRTNAGSIHLLLTDVIMPVMNGRELFEKLKTIKPDLLALYMSGYDKDIIADHGVLEEDTYYIPKPFTVISLAKKVREVLDANIPAG